MRYSLVSLTVSGDFALVSIGILGLKKNKNLVDIKNEVKQSAQGRLPLLKFYITNLPIVKFFLYIFFVNTNRFTLRFSA